MKTRMVMLILVVGFLASSCGPKPYYQTSIGKEKWRYYNKTQYGLQPKHAPKF